MLRLSCLAVVSVLVACVGAGSAGDEAPADWRKKFDAVYRLEDDEIVKFIPPPFIPERELYCRHQFTGNPNAPLNSDGWSLAFQWKDGKAQFWSVSSLPGTVGRVIKFVGIDPMDLETDAAFSDIPVPVDCIIRRDAKP